jgi:hypothetical protein
LTLLMVGVVAQAAPIPKSLKRQRTSGEPNGVWELTRFNSNGQEGKHQGMARYWEIDGEKFYIGIASPGDRGQTSGSDFKITDENDPDFRMFSETYSSRLKVNGDELSWVYTSDKNLKLEECDPGQGRFYYEFKRVK